VRLVFFFCFSIFEKIYFYLTRAFYPLRNNIRVGNPRQSASMLSRRHLLFSAAAAGMASAMARAADQRFRQSPRLLTALDRSLDLEIAASKANEPAA